MKKILFIFMIILTACGQSKTPQKNIESTAKNAALNNQTYINADELDLTEDFVTGQFDYRNHEAFVLVSEQHADDSNTYLHKQTYKAFKKMYESAKKAGITLTIVSGTRNFYDQKDIWEGKWETFEVSSDLRKALKILNYSSMPMTSRHHWGTDIDLNNLNNSYFESGQGKKEYEWLKAHANEFGFYQPYTDKSLHGRTGYNEEKWHWSYVPLGDKYRVFYNEHITNEDITGFEGSELAGEIDMVGKYVNGVSLKIKNYSE